MLVRNCAAGYILSTGAVGGDSSPFQQLVTIDSPTSGAVVDSAIGKQGIYFKSVEILDTGEYLHSVHVLPTPGGNTIVPYEKSKKQIYTWKSKKFVMPGRTTFAAAKVVMNKGCVRLIIYVDGCCRYDAVVQNCAPFRLPDQLAGIELEIELIGQATIYEVHVASTIEELIRVRQSE